MGKRFKVKIDIDNDVLARPVKPEEDLLFIFNSWLKSYRHSDFANLIDAEDYYENHHKLITSIIMQATNSITILCDPEDTNHILGYIVYNTKQPIVYYTYVKHSFRGLGLGRYLLESIRKNYGKDVVVTCTHKTKNWRKLKKIGLNYNPYLLKEKTDEKPNTNKES